MENKGMFKIKDKVDYCKMDKGNITHYNYILIIVKSLFCKINVVPRASGL